MRVISSNLTCLLLWYNFITNVNKSVISFIFDIKSANFIRTLLHRINISTGETLCRTVIIIYCTAQCFPYFMIASFVSFDEKEVSECKNPCFLYRRLCEFNKRIKGSISMSKFWMSCKMLIIRGITREHTKASSLIWR